MTDEVALEPEIHVNPIVHLLAPLVAIGATMIVRKVITTSYRSATGKDAPRSYDPGVPFGKALLWATATAAIAAGVEVVAYRVTNHLGATRATD